MRLVVHPTRIFVGVVDQLGPHDRATMDVFCEEMQSIRKMGTGLPLSEKCPYADNVRVKSLDAKHSKGPVRARSFQHQLMQEEDFCLQVDAHSQASVTRFVAGIKPHVFLRTCALHIILYPGREGLGRQVSGAMEAG